MAQVMEQLLCKHKFQSSKPRSQQNQLIKKKKKKPIDCVTFKSRYLLLTVLEAGKSKIKADQYLVRCYLVYR
jgi:hypothetical protein